MRLTKEQRSKWLELIRKLRAITPADRRIHVSTRRLRLWDGHIDLYRDGMGLFYRIIITSLNNFDLRCETLAHEWAHALDNFERHDGDEEKQHMEPWGVYYSKCYRIARIVTLSLKGRRRGH